jgi:hypothetical protein
MSPDDLLTGPQIAVLIGVSPSTWRAYVARGQAPAPDDPDTDRPPNRHTPRWLISTIDAWREARRGQAWRRR